MNTASLLAWLFDAATLIGLALLFASIVYGAMLLVMPQTTLRASQRLNRAYSSRRAMRPLEIPRPTERFFYRHHRLAGSLLLAGVMIFLGMYFFRVPDTSLILRLGAPFSRGLAEVVLLAIERFLLIANVLTGIFALVVVLRPSALKPLEARANRWFSTRRALRPLEEVRDPLDRFTARFPRATGALILLGGGYVLASLIVVLNHSGGT